VDCWCERMLANVLVAVKPFDIDLNWMSKFRNQEKAAFWMADDDDGTSNSTRSIRTIPALRSAHH
jgi:hypothetical protein